MTIIPPLKQKLQGILFDKDGTLVDFDRTWGPIIRRCTSYAADGDPGLSKRLLVLGGMDPATGRTSADSLFAACNTAEIVDAFIEAGAPFTRADLIRDFDRMFVAASAEAVPIADTPALFANLRARGLKLGIASSDNAASIAETARTLGIAGLVDFIAGYDSGHGAKPGAGMFQAFCTTIGAPSGAIAMVGDNRHDMAMGRAAGAGLKIGVLSGTGTRETLSEIADICLDSIADLPALLDAVQE